MGIEASGLLLSVKTYLRYFCAYAQLSRSLGYGFVEQNKGEEVEGVVFIHLTNIFIRKTTVAGGIQSPHLSAKRVYKDVHFQSTVSSLAPQAILKH